MVRVREFDPDDALDKAMALFWERGYAHTSMEDLVRHTGVSRYGLYGTFGNKDEIYRLALMRYTRMLKQEMQQDLSDPAAGRPELEAYFRTVAGFVNSDAGKRGCMIANTIYELAPHDPGMADHLHELQEDLRAKLERTIANGQAAGDIRRDIPAPALAMTLFTLIQGMAALHRGGSDVAELMPCFDTFLGMIDG